MNHSNVWTYRWHGGQALSGERALDEFDLVIHLWQIAAHVATEHCQWQASSTGFIGAGHGSVAVLQDLQFIRPAFLDGISQAMQ